MRLDRDRGTFQADMSSPSQLLRLMTVPEAAATLHVGRSTIYNLLAAGTLVSIKVRGCRRIPEQAISALVANLIEQGP